MGSLRFVPSDGEWTVLAAWPTVVTLSARASDEVVQAIWNALSVPDATIESVVSSIPIRGAAADASFSVVRFEPGDDIVFDAAHPPLEWSATVVVRGTAAVDLLSVGGSRRFGSGGVQPWALAEFPSVTGLSTGALPPVPESLLRLPADARRLDHGIAHASRVLWAASAEMMVSEHATHPWDHTAERLSLDPDTADGDTVLSGPTDGTPDAPGAASVYDRGELYAADAAAAIARADTAPIDTAPVTTGPIDTPTVVDPPPVYELRIGDRPAFELTGAVVVGRKPHARRTASAEQQTLITVESPAKEVSANHVEIARLGRTVVVTDLRSMNGTTVLLPGRPAVRLRQGDSVVASGSAIVEIGDGNVIHISSRERPISGMTV
jgi:hypothetical protein